MGRTRACFPEAGKQSLDDDDDGDSSSSSNSSSSSSEQAERVKRFFETLELDLMGTKLRYQNMRVLENGVALDLYVLVEKFPPPVIDF